MVIYTLILVLYVLLNISGDFWTNNLLEPLLVSYAIIGIVVLILSYNLSNRWAVLFQQIFPKVLLPIVVFQTIASVLKIGEMGVTHGRYYVILFGVFAIISGFIFSFWKPKNHGYIAVAILVLAALSIVPPIDAFTFSKNSQLTFLEEKLQQNDLIENGEIVANPNVPVEERIAITNAVTYINDMGYNKDVSYLPDNFYAYNDFERLFGFNLTYSETVPDRDAYEVAYLDISTDFTLDIETYDVMVGVQIYNEEDRFETISFELDGETFLVEGEKVDGYYQLSVLDSAQAELITFDIAVIFEEIFGDASSTAFIEQNLTAENAEFTEENEQAGLKIFVKSLERSADYQSAEFYLFIEIK